MNEQVTPAEVNALPPRIRKHIHDLATISDPAGMVQEIASLKDQVRQLSAAHKTTVKELNEFRQAVAVMERNRQFRAFCDRR